MFRELLRQKLIGVASLTSRELDLLEEHYRLLVRWNRVLNLTSIEDLDEVVERHYSESVFLAVHLPPHPLRVADLGSGAGFPGFPLAVLRPDCSITLVEGHRRKAVFLREASRGLPNVRVLPVRFENLEEPPFDRAVCRAVSYHDLQPALRKLARAADLLTGVEAPPASLGFNWDMPIRLPWARKRFLRSGVPRETPKPVFHVEHEPAETCRDIGESRDT
jgi:16S rRNA (guanine(527)-N(7))-methyltransferase RsmG